MNLTQRPEIGEPVHLRPRTKTTSAACRAYREGRVLSYDQWPYVRVELVYRAGEEHIYGDTITVHSDNCGLNPATDKPKGDMAGGQANAQSIPKPLHTKVKPLDLPPGWAEETLF